MKDEVRERLPKILVKTIEHQAKTEEDRKAQLASYNEEIKGAKKRIGALAATLAADDPMYLQDVFDPVEIEQFLR